MFDEMRRTSSLEAPARVVAVVGRDLRYARGVSGRRPDCLHMSTAAALSLAATGHEAQVIIQKRSVQASKLRSIAGGPKGRREGTEKAQSALPSKMRNCHECCRTAHEPAFCSHSLALNL